MKIKNVILTVLLLAIYFNFNTIRKADAADIKYGFVGICSVTNKSTGARFRFDPPLNNLKDARLNNVNWQNYQKTNCSERGYPVSLEGYCSPFPDRTSIVGEYAPFCDPGKNERVHAYVCESGDKYWDGCGPTSAIYKKTDYPKDKKISMKDIKESAGNKYACGKTIQVDILNASCTNDMIAQHYALSEDKWYNPEYFPKDAQGNPQFCLVKDAFVWYTGSCKAVPPQNPNIGIIKSIDGSKTEGNSPYESGDVIVFKLVIENKGNVKLTNVVIKEEVPKYTSFNDEVSAAHNAEASNGGKEWSCKSGKCSYPLGDLAAGQKVTVYFAVTVNSYDVDGNAKSENTACVEAKNKDVALKSCDDVDFDLKDKDPDDDDEDDNDEKEVKLDIDKFVRVEGGKWKEKVTGVKKGDVIEFKIRIINEGDDTLSNLKMEDFMPDELERIGGAGLTEYWDRFKPGETEEFVIEVKVKDSEFTGNVDECIVNEAKVSREGKKAGNAKATVCYSNMSVTELPETGPEGTAAMTVGGLALSVAGIYIRRRILG